MYFKPSRKKKCFVFLPLPILPVQLKILHLRKYDILFHLLFMNTEKLSMQPLILIKGHFKRFVLLFTYLLLVLLLHLWPFSSHLQIEINVFLFPPKIVVFILISSHFLLHFQAENIIHSGGVRNTKSLNQNIKFVFASAKD